MLIKMNLIKPIITHAMFVSSDTKLRSSIMKATEYFIIVV